MCCVRTPRPRHGCLSDAVYGEDVALQGKGITPPNGSGARIGRGRLTAVNTWLITNFLALVTVVLLSLKSVCLNKIPASSSWMQIAFLIVSAFPARFTKSASRYLMAPLQSQPNASELVMYLDANMSVNAF